MAYYNGTLVSERPEVDCSQSGVIFPWIWGLVVDELLEILKTNGFLEYDYVAIIAMC